MLKSNSKQLVADSGILEVKSKFAAEFRRFSILKSEATNYEMFKSLIEQLHGLKEIPFIISYTDPSDNDLLPINNDDNLARALLTARPLLRLHIQRKGESLEELNGYGTFRPRNLISTILGGTPGKSKSYPSISNPHDFRKKSYPVVIMPYSIMKMLIHQQNVLKTVPTTLLLVEFINSPVDERNNSAPAERATVSAIIDVDVVPEAHRRVRLLKHGSDKPLGFYIRDGTSVRVTPSGLEKMPGIFISRLVPGGLAESTGLLAVNDEVLEVNGIDVAGKTLDQVTDMMVANSSNLVVTVKPANQRTTMAAPRRGSFSRTSQTSNNSNNEDKLEEEDIVVTY